MFPKKYMTCFYINDSSTAVEKMDYILQLSQWLYSLKTLGISQKSIYLLDIHDSINSVKKFLSSNGDKLSLKILKMLLELLKGVTLFKKRKVGRKNLSSAELEFIGVSYFSKKQVSGLYTHIDVTFTAIPRNIINGLSSGLVRNKLSLYKGRAKHYKTFKFKTVYFTCAIFLNSGNFNNWIKINKKHEKDLLSKTETFLINNYRYILIKKFQPKVRKIKEFYYNYWGNGNVIDQKFKLIHYDSFFKPNKSGYVPNLNLIIKDILEEIKYKNCRCSLAL